MFPQYCRELLNIVKHLSKRFKKYVFYFKVRQKEIAKAKAAMTAIPSKEIDMLSRMTALARIVRTYP